METEEVKEHPQGAGPPCPPGEKEQTLPPGGGGKEQFLSSGGKGTDSGPSVHPSLPPPSLLLLT